MLVALLNGQRITSFVAQKGDDFICPECGSPLILKQGDVNVYHFSHKAKNSCSLNENESEEHLRIKESMYKAIKAMGFIAELEYKIGDSRTDIALFINDRKIAVEVQLSPIDSDVVDKRIRIHSEYGFSTCWIHGRLDCFGKDYTRVPKWLDYIHELNGDELIYRHIDGVMIRPIHFDDTSHWEDSISGSNLACPIYCDGSNVRVMTSSDTISVLDTYDDWNGGVDCCLARMKDGRGWWADRLSQERSDYITKTTKRVVANSIDNYISFLRTGRIYHDCQIMSEIYYMKYHKFSNNTVLFRLICRCYAGGWSLDDMIKRIVENDNPKASDIINIIQESVKYIKKKVDDQLIRRHQTHPWEVYTNHKRHEC